MAYELEVDQKTGGLLARVTITNGDSMLENQQIFVYPTSLQSVRSMAINWIVQQLRQMNPEGPVRMTRKKVYNERVHGRPMFWEITTYNAKGERLHSGQYSAVMQEGYLRGLVQKQFGFPLEAAEEIE